MTSNYLNSITVAVLACFCLANVSNAQALPAKKKHEVPQTETRPAPHPRAHNRAAGVNAAQEAELTSAPAPAPAAAASKFAVNNKRNVAVAAPAPAIVPAAAPVKQVAQVVAAVPAPHVLTAPNPGIGGGGGTPSVLMPVHTATPGSLVVAATTKARMFRGNGDESSLLRDAYRTLERADHDYMGHRIRAMEHISAGARTLGQSLGGDGRAGEPQGESDAQLRTASGILKQVQVEAAERRQERLLEQVDAALRQIDVALSIR